MACIGRSLTFPIYTVRVLCSEVWGREHVYLATPDSVTIYVAVQNAQSAQVSIPIGSVKLWLLPGYCLVTAWLLPGYSLVTVWLLSGYCLVTVWLQPGYSLVTVWLQPGYCLVTVWLLPVA
jgi:hypothetical protein